MDLRAVLPSTATLACGFFELRRTCYRTALENLIERNGEAGVTAGSIVRAVEASARIDDQGKWVDPPHQIIVTRVIGTDRPTGPSQPVPIVHATSPYSNRQPASSIVSASSIHENELQSAQPIEN